LILIEGPDGAGKTTLAAELAKEFYLVGTHSPGPKGTRERTYDALGEAVKGNAPVRIHDRLYYSELVYGRVLRGEVQFSHYERAYVETVLHGALNCPIIFCLPPLEVVVGNVEATRDEQKAGDDPVFPRIGEIYAQYDQIARNLSWMKTTSVMRYSYLEPSQLLPIKKTVESYLEKRRSRTW